jgi:hypothetical protein
MIHAFLFLTKRDRDRDGHEAQEMLQQQQQGGGGSSFIVRLLGPYATN